MKPTLARVRTLTTLAEGGHILPSRRVISTDASVSPNYHITPNIEYLFRRAGYIEQKDSPKGVYPAWVWVITDAGRNKLKVWSQC